ncbi:Retinal dehydrogenase 1 [Eumeta japonica]|uniref:aldehyde dehydrogenase (NAD(+)) n=1 Tax=Eumeta variegata TaxID=151549 RepID=A0A4C1UCX7_EUMVA|nr:Retinal dehydrogenase 1 [Eumeta japonica]
MRFSSTVLLGKQCFLIIVTPCVIRTKPLQDHEESSLSGAYSGSGGEENCTGISVTHLLQLFIDNEWVDAESGKTFETFSPHDGKVIAKVAEGDKADIEKAVAAARRAFHRKSEWRGLTASARGRLLHRFADLIERDAQYLATLESTNNGAVSTMTPILMSGAANYARYTAGLADKIHGDTIPSDFEGFTYTLRQPVGVCGLILPWNAPVLMFVHKVVIFQPFSLYC